MISPTVCSATAPPPTAAPSAATGRWMRGCARAAATTPTPTSPPPRSASPATSPATDAPAAPTPTALPATSPTSTTPTTASPPAPPALPPSPPCRAVGARATASPAPAHQPTVSPATIAPPIAYSSPTRDSASSPAHFTPINQDQPVNLVHTDAITARPLLASTAILTSIASRTVATRTATKSPCSMMGLPVEPPKYAFFVLTVVIPAIPISAPAVSPTTVSSTRLAYSSVSSSATVPRLYLQRFFPCLD